MILQKLSHFRKASSFIDLDTALGTLKGELILALIQDAAFGVRLASEKFLRKQS